MGRWVMGQWVKWVSFLDGSYGSWIDALSPMANGMQLRLFPETVEALSIVIEGYKNKFSAVNCHGRTSFLTHLSPVHVSHSLTEIEQCCIFTRVFFYLLCIKHFYCFLLLYKVRGCVVNLVGHGSLPVTHCLLCTAAPQHDKTIVSVSCLAWRCELALRSPYLTISMI